MIRGSQAGAAVSFAMTLVACGGGGSGGSNITPSPTDYNLQAGVAHMVAQGLTSNVSLSGTVTVNGTSTPFSGSGTYTLAAAKTATFNGGAASSQTQTISGSVSAQGQSAPYTATVTDYYSADHSAFLGEDDGNEFDVAQTPITYPTSVVGGSGGDLGTISRYSDMTMSVVLGTAKISYSASGPTDTGGPIQITLTTKVYDTQSALTETDTTVYKMTTGNVISFVSGSVQNQSGTITVTAN